MSNVTRPVFNPSTGLRIKYAEGCPPYDPNTGLAIRYGEDRSGPEWDQTTGLRVGQVAQINLSTAGAAIPPTVNAAPEAEFSEDDEDVGDGAVIVTRISDQAYEDYPAQTVVGGLSVNQIRNMFRTALGLTDGMVALVNGVLANNTRVVEGGSNVIFKEPAKRRG